MPCGWIIGTPAPSRLGVWTKGSRIIPANSDISDTVPGAMYRDMVAKWSEAEAVTLALRARLAAHGDDAPGPPGTVTLLRLRRLEDVMDLAREYLFDPTDDKRGTLWAAIVDAGRAP